jgi:large subunit ribosomal protein L19
MAQLSLYQSLLLTPHPTESEHSMKKIRVFPAAPSARAVCKDPIAAVTATQLTTLDPTGARSRLFSRDNVDRANVGDILLVRLKNGDQFAGVCLNIRRQGIDTAILLRNNLTRVGVEMWYKIYSPNVQGVEVVQRKEKRARRARLYYMRQPRHDIGSVDNIVRQYQRQRAMLRSSEVKSRDANSRKKSNKRG